MGSIPGSVCIKPWASFGFHTASGHPVVYVLGAQRKISKVGSTVVCCLLVGHAGEGNRAGQISQKSYEILVPGLH